jgi:hypothetical protein
MIYLIIGSIIWVALGAWGWWILCGKETLEDINDKNYFFVFISMVVICMLMFFGLFGLLAAWLTRDELE